MGSQVKWGGLKLFTSFLDGAKRASGEQYTTQEYIIHQRDEVNYLVQNLPLYHISTALANY